MKKVLSILLAAMLALGLLAACGNSGDSSSQQSQGSSSQSGGDSSVQQPQGDPDKIIVSFLYPAAVPSDLEVVREAVNAISVPAINVEVEFKTLTIPESFSNYSLWITGGEQMDLMCVAFSGLSSYITNGQIEPLDDLIAEYGPTISQLAQEYPITDSARYRGQVYGVTPVMADYGAQGAYLIKQRYLDEIELERKDVYTLDELTEIFGAIKALHPDLYPCGITGANVTSGNSLFQYFGVVDPLGATYQSGVLMSMDSTTIVNLFETEEYKAYLAAARTWYSNGYIMTDAATTDASGEELLTNEVTAGFAMMNKPLQVPSQGVRYGEPFEALCLTKPFRAAESPSGNTQWTIPITSKSPEAAMKFLDLTYADHALSNLLMFGIEGQHYEQTNTEDVISMIDQSAYGAGFGVWGDRRYEYFTTDLLTREMHQSFTKEAAKNTSIASGYIFDSSAFTNQLIAIQSVMDEYLPSLETGSVSDWEGTLATFLSKLKDAGIDDVIAENQSQFDAWLASK